VYWLIFGFNADFDFISIYSFIAVFIALQPFTYLFLNFLGLHIKPN